MKTKLENEKEFRAAIDEFGEMQDKVDAMVNDQKIRRQVIESYALENKIRTCATKFYKMSMKKQDASLLKDKDMTAEDVVALLKKDEVGREFVTETYNAAAIKAHAKSIKDSAEWLAELGLSLTEPKYHPDVKRI